MNSIVNIKKNVLLKISLILIICMGLTACMGLNNTNELDSTNELGSTNKSDSETSDLTINDLETIDKETESIDSETKENNTDIDFENVEARVEQYMSNMSLHEKVCQMFVITPESLTGYNLVTEFDEQARLCMEEYPIGGLVYFKANIVNPLQTTDMLGGFMKYSVNTSGIPLFQCIDEEGGRVMRIGNNDAFDVESISAMGNVKSKEEAYNIGNTIGMYLRKYGFNVDFAPVADVITNEKNKVIGDRSFGSDANIVVSYATSVSDGLHSAGILSTFKHFPGHGATEGDTHEGFAYTNKTYEEMKIAELVPFAKASENDIDMVMVAHISVPNIVGDNTPCSLSYKMITEILKGDLGYDGLVITDALNMGAIKNEYGSETATLMAVKAGVDILLMPTDFRASVEAVKDAVEKGEISIERIDESVRKILTKKFYEIK